MSYIEQAGRVTDPVKHSELEFRIGLSIVALLGGAAAIALTPLTLGGSAVLMVTLAEGANLVGGIADGRGFDAAIAAREVDPEGDEDITHGAATVFLDEARERAAKAHPDTTVDHGSHWVTHGSTTVLIENTWASRLGDRTSCGGYVCFGSETIFYGGDQVNFPGSSLDPDEVTPGFWGAYETALLVASVLTLAGEGAALLALRRGRLPLVWDNITPTQPNYDGTIIPRSFTMRTPHGDVWVHPNASEHLAERAVGAMNRGPRTVGVSDPMGLANLGSQAQLSSLQTAVDEVLSQGPLNYGQTYSSGQWTELVFGAPNSPGDLPALFHANDF